jgi:hypothetical protein
MDTPQLSSKELLTLYHAVGEERRLALLDSLTDIAARRLLEALERAPIEQERANLAARCPSIHPMRDPWKRRR